MKTYLLRFGVEPKRGPDELDDGPPFVAYTAKTEISVSRQEK